MEYNFSLTSVATVGLERDTYTFSEESTDAEVCLEVVNPDSNCPVSSSFSVVLLTLDGTAGQFYILFLNLFTFTLHLQKLL